MITEQYIYEEEIIKASDCYKKREKILDICIITLNPILQTGGKLCLLELEQNIGYNPS